MIHKTLKEYSSFEQISNKFSLIGYILSYFVLKYWFRNTLDSWMYSKLTSFLPLSIQRVLIYFEGTTSKTIMQKAENCPFVWMTVCNKNIAICILKKFVWVSVCLCVYVCVCVCVCFVSVCVCCVCIFDSYSKIVLK